VAEGVVWISEDEDTYEPEGGMLLGTFSGHLDAGGSAPADEFEGLTAEEAIAWGRARADRVYIRLGRSGSYSAGARKSREFPAWPPPDLPPLVRRRPPEEEWRDRTEADDPIPWRVDVHLVPPNWDTAELADERARWEATVAAVAAVAGADGWDGDQIEGHFADYEAARARSGGAEEFGWASYYHPCFDVHLTVHAPTQVSAIEQGLARCSVPEGWTIGASARPEAFR
jgi:hypothetical protein